MVMLRSRAWVLPPFIEPCLPSLAKQPAGGSDWFHEIKRDGFRIMARRDAPGARLMTAPLRGGKELSGKSAGNFDN